MPKGLVFWVLMLLWIISWISWRWRNWGPGQYGFELFAIVLFFILGWQAFGFIIR
jgi:hypothetical protein